MIGDAKNPILVLSLLVCAEHGDGVGECRGVLRQGSLGGEDKLVDLGQRGLDAEQSQRRRVGDVCGPGGDVIVPNDHGLHANSIEAHAEGARGPFGHRAVTIIACLQMRHSPATDRDIMQSLGFRDMNSVRPRISELVKRGTLAEVGTTTDPVTLKRVRLVDIAKSQDQTLLPL